MTDEQTLGETAGIGDNSQSQLVAFVERAERVMEEIAGMREDLGEIFAEAKGVGYDVKIMRLAIRVRAMDPAKRQEQEALLDTYLSALGSL